MNITTLKFILIASLLVAQSVVADDADTRDLLIEKLTKVYLNLAPSEPSKVAVTLRLADLHAERGRQVALKDLDSGCSVCTAGRDDRLKALRYYQEVLPKVPDANAGNVLTQVGHLYELTGNEAEAIKVYNRIIEEKRLPSAVAEANLSLAEVYFKRRDFDKAKIHYQAVLSGNGGSRGLASYRIAWCDFNRDRLNSAIDQMVHILKTPQLLSRAATGDVVQVDMQFQEEVSRDLATFLARRPIRIEDAELVYDLSPPKAKVANATYLASEVERLGQIQSALAIWRFTLERQSKPESRLEGHLHLAQLQMEQKLYSEALKDYEMSLSLWSQIGTQCTGDQCKEMKTRIRNFVVDWHKVVKAKPTPELLDAYEKYLVVFVDDLDASVWAGQVAKELKKYPQSAGHLNHGIDLAVVQNQPAKLESALLNLIETAELSRDSALLTQAYDQYLKYSKERSKALEVSYQRAKLVYDAGQYASASEELKKVALSSEKGAANLKKQAADLSLDALVLAKNDSLMESWAKEYATAFPTSGVEFRSIERKSQLTQSAQLAKNEQTLEQAWGVLARFNPSDASPEERKTYYKNRLILAEKLNKIPEAREAADQILRQKDLSTEDRDFAWSRKSWYAELTLDFDGALTSLEKIPVTKGDDARLLKLAMFAELANKNPSSFYTKYLVESRDDEKKANIAALIVKASTKPMIELKKQSGLLSKQPQVLADLGLELYPQLGLEIVYKVLENKAAAATDSGKVLKRLVLLQKASKHRARLAAHKLDGQTQKKLAQSIKTRAQLLNEAEKLAAEAIDLGDWSGQLVSLDIVSKESARFHEEILSLPIPSGLSSEEEQQYLELLAQQAAPHKTRADEISLKLQEFYKNDEAFKTLENSYATSVAARREVIKAEMAAVKTVVPIERQNQIDLALQARLPEAAKPRVDLLESARLAVRQDPFSRPKLEELLRLEREAGRATMASYLQGRLQSKTEEKK